MRLSNALFGLLTVAFSGSLHAVSTENSFDCSGKDDGNYGERCASFYTACSAGLAYTFNCPDNLLFDSTSSRCEYPAGCEKPVIDEFAAVPFAPSPVVEDVTQSYRVSHGFDCSKLSDGFYADGCSSSYVVCSYGTSTVAHCPVGLLFDSSASICDYPDKCRPSSDDPSTTTMSSYSQVEETTTTDTPAETSEETYTTETTTVYTTTSTMNNDVPETTPIVDSSFCSAGDTSSLGDCSTKFLRCRNETWVSAFCPGATVFDDTIGLCVYELPRCKTGILSSKTSGYTSGYGDNSYGSNNYSPTAPPSGPVPYRQRPVSNPFYALRSYRHKHRKSDRHRRPRVHHGKIYFVDAFDGYNNPVIVDNYPEVFPRSQVRRHGKHHKDSYVDEEGDEVAGDPSDLEQEIAEAPVQTNEEDTKLSISGTVDVTESGDKTEPSVDVSVQNQAFVKTDDNILPSVDQEGSGDEDQEQSKTPLVRRKRSYGYEEAPTSYSDSSSVCQDSTSGSLVSLGFCRRDFVYCRTSRDAVLAACPVGELYDDSQSRCRLAFSCGEESIVRDFPSVTSPTYSPGHNYPIGEDSAVTSSYSTVTPGYERPEQNYPRGEDSAVTSSYSTVTSGYERPEQTYVQPTPSRPSNDQDSVLRFSACDGRKDAVVALGCSRSYLVCSSGKTVEMNCPEGLVYNELASICDHPRNVVECSPSSEGSKRPGPYKPQGGDKPHDDEPIDRPVDTYKPHGGDHPISSTDEPTTQTSIASDTSSSSSYDYGCVGGSVGVCLDRYTVCKDGKPFEITCSDNLVYNSASGSCEHRELVPECSSPSYDNQVVETTTESTVCQEGTFVADSCSRSYKQCSNGQLQDFECAHNQVFDKDSNSCKHRHQVVGCSNSHVAHSSSGKSCEYNGNVYTMATGYCVSSYKTCNEGGVLETSACELGYLFDPRIGKCVVASECGAVSRASPYDSQCKGKENSVISLGPCRHAFIRCSAGAAVTEHCSGKTVFSSKHGRCVRRQRLSECTSHVEYVNVKTNNSEFCFGRVDGLYRDPNDCTGVVQCFGGDLFLHSACTSGLVFNEKSGQCDYRQNVAGCAEPADSKMETGCRGAEHGAYIREPADCSIFYRCVWNRLEKMHCPSGTVFNPVLSVCDWPAKVPQCDRLSSSTSKPY